MLADQLRSALQARKERKTLRKLTLHSTAAHQHNAFIQNQDPSNSNLNLLSSNSIDSTSTSTSNLIDFSSNDYLSIATSPTLHSIFSHKIKQDMQRGFRLGSSGSRLLDGNSLHHLHLESYLCSLFHSPASLLFNSGYEANVSIFSTLPQPNDIIIYDSLIHASVHDGMRSSRTEKRLRFSFNHNDLSSFESLIQSFVDPESRSHHEQHDASSSSSSSSTLTLSERIQISTDLKEGKRNVFLALETVYSMDGDFCLLTEFLDLFEKYFEKKENRFVVIDEAHSTGVYGGENDTRSTDACNLLEGTNLKQVLDPSLESKWGEGRREGSDSQIGGGEGFTFQQKELNRVDIRLMTFGKAVGAVGAAVLCQPLVREYLINYARPLIFSTALPLPNVHLISSSLQVLSSPEGQLRRNYLYKSARYFLQSLVSFIPIVPDKESKSSPSSTTSSKRTLLSLPSTLFPSSTTSTSDHRHQTEPTLISIPRKPSPIIPILTSKAKILSSHLIDRGYLVRPITYPTVPKGKDRIRICLHSGNRKEEIDGLIKELRNWYVDQIRLANEGHQSESLEDEGKTQNLPSKL